MTQNLWSDHVRKNFASLHKVVVLKCPTKNLICIFETSLTLRDEIEIDDSASSEQYPFYFDSFLHRVNFF